MRELGIGGSEAEAEAEVEAETEAETEAEAEAEAEVMCSRQGTCVHAGPPSPRAAS